jgi:hypothetical protein
MTITLHLKPEVEAGLLVQAQANGVEVDQYILSLVENAVRPQPPSLTTDSQQARKDAVRRMIEFGGKQHLSLGESITRGLLHEDHRF